MTTRSVDRQQHFGYEGQFTLKNKIPSSMKCGNGGSFARDVYPTQDTSRIGTMRVQQEEESEDRIIAKYD